MAILWNTFGLLGLASCIAWATAAALLLRGLPVRHRLARWLVAAAVAAAGLVLANVTSDSIRDIEVDRSAEVQAAEKAAAETAQERLRSRASSIRFAEDTQADRADVAGVSVAEEQGTYERAVEEELAKIPAYRQRGRQKRSPTSSGTAAAVTTTSGSAAAPAEETPKQERQDDGVRRLPEADLVVADRYDRLNRLLSRLVLGLAVGLVGYEYVRRFNTTYDAACPVPLAGTFVDGLLDKRHVDVPRDITADVLAAWARKGESFILFADADPLVGRDDLERFSIGPVRLPLGRFSRTVGPFRWSVPARCFSAAAVAADPTLAEMVFESAWFGRGCFVILHEPGANEVLADVVARLERRRHCRARTRRTLTIAWTLPAPPPPDCVAELGRLSEPMNLRTIAP